MKFSITLFVSSLVIIFLVLAAAHQMIVLQAQQNSPMEKICMFQNARLAIKLMDQNYTPLMNGGKFLMIWGVKQS